MNLSDTAFTKYIKIQNRERSKLVLKDKLPDYIRTIGGVDQSFQKNKVISGIVILKYETMELLEKVYSKTKINFPYIPGLLTFREGPVIIKTYKKLELKPDILMLDGQGIAHPRKMGIASHIGLILNKPTIGVAKSKLVGNYKNPKKVGEISYLFYKNEKVGAVMKTKKGCNPIFISPGHKISLETSIQIVRNCVRDYKLPEPTRLAHKFVNEVKG